MQQKRWSRVVAQFMGITLLLSLLAACGATSAGTNPPGNGSTGEAKIIKLATNLPVSGKDTSNGKPTENGANMAIEEANASNYLPGYKFALVPKDDVGPDGVHDPATGAKNLTELIGDAMVAAVVGPFNSNVARAEMPIANQEGIALISPSNTNQCLTQSTEEVGCGGKNNEIPVLRPTGKVTYFRIAGTDNFQGPAGAQYLYGLGKYKNLYLIDDTETYGVGIANSFEKKWKELGGTVLGRASQPSTQSYISLLTKIAAAKPDVIYFGGTDSNGGILIRQQMFQVPDLKNVAYAGGDGIASSGFANTVGTKGVNQDSPTFGTIAAPDVNIDPKAKTWIDNYTKTYGQLGAYSASGYDSMKILIQAVKEAIASGGVPAANESDAAAGKAFREKVIAAIQTLKYEGGITGSHSFDANGDTTNGIITILQLVAVGDKADWKGIDSVIAK